ncbi:MAG TPA: peptide-methionine (S)-S-oxide reductase MsrA [Clostridia bacterium]|nr:peptide-methionine (S)-S-oxide reductase MsrA [Clostridia bacterium]
MATRETAILGAGCFWCVEAAFKQLDGVETVQSGYMGGAVENPTYKQVCSGKTGHVEVARVEFDPAKISFGEVLDVFFTVHDPTTLNRQGNDIGTQYRSVIFYTGERQKSEAEQKIRELTDRKAWPNPIVTTIEPASKFYVAEDYHQDYFANNAYQPYCMFVVAPKVEKVRAKFESKLKDAPAS